MRIRWTRPAADDLTHICDYIEEHDTPATARRVALAIYESILALVRFPRRGRTGRFKDTCELVILSLPYIAIHRVHEDVIEAVRILHGAQEWA